MTWRPPVVPRPHWYRNPLKFLDALSHWRNSLFERGAPDHATEFDRAREILANDVGNEDPSTRAPAAARAQVEGSFRGLANDVFLRGLANDVYRLNCLRIGCEGSSEQQLRIANNLFIVSKVCPLPHLPIGTPLEVFSLSV